MKLGVQQRFAVVNLRGGNTVIGFGAIQPVAIGDRLFQELRSIISSGNGGLQIIAEWRDAKIAFACLAFVLQSCFVPYRLGALIFGQPCKLCGITLGTLFEGIQLGASTAH